MSLEIKGVDRLLGKLRQLKKVKAKAAIRKGARAAAKVVRDQAQALVPVRSGALQKAIKVRSIGKSRKWVGAKVTAKGAGAPAYWVGFVDLGTRRQKAQKFLERTAEQAKGQAAAVFTETIAREINAAGA